MKNDVVNQLGSLNVLRTSREMSTMGSGTQKAYCHEQSMTFMLGSLKLVSSEGTWTYGPLCSVKCLTVILILEQRTQTLLVQIKQGELKLRNGRCPVPSLEGPGRGPVLKGKHNIIDPVTPSF